MKKTKAYKLPKTNAQAIAKNLRHGMGRDGALRIAENQVKNLKGVGPEDFNRNLFTLAEIQKNERIWTQVHNILANQKGFTVFELLVVLGILASIAAGAAVLFAAAHFIHKFW